MNYRTAPHPKLIVADLKRRLGTLDENHRREALEIIAAPIDDLFSYTRQDDRIVICQRVPDPLCPFRWWYFDAPASGPASQSDSWLRHIDTPIRILCIMAALFALTVAILVLGT